MWLNRITWCTVIVSMFCSSNNLCFAQSVPSITGLRCEYKVNPIGIDVDKPRLSWKIQSSERGVMQAAYQIRAADNAESLATEKKLLWDSGKVVSEQSIHVVYAGPELKSRQRVYWQVRIWNNHGLKSEWSEAAFWEMGLLEWLAHVIIPGVGFILPRQISGPERILMHFLFQ